MANKRNKKKKYMIEYLDIDDRFYIENDDVKVRLTEEETTDTISWDEMWDEALKIIDAARKYDEEINRYSSE